MKKSFFFFFSVFLLKTKKYENSSHIEINFSILIFLYINYFRIISICNPVSLHSFQISQSISLVHKLAMSFLCFTYPEGILPHVLSLDLAFWFLCACVCVCVCLSVFSFSVTAYFFFYFLLQTSFILKVLVLTTVFKGDNLHKVEWLLFQHLSETLLKA